MKPDFTLSLTFEGIRLLQRADKEWRVLGEVDVSDPDLDKKLNIILSETLKVSPHARRVKVQIPNEQIKFLHLPRQKQIVADDIEREIEKSLKGATPYKLEELVYDWVATKDDIFVAAVATETLEEASHFASLQGFEPLGMVASPPQKSFKGEAFFGKADGNRKEMECDDIPIRILSSEKETREQNFVSGIKLNPSIEHNQSLSENSSAIDILHDEQISFQTTRDEELDTSHTDGEEILFQSIRNSERSKLEGSHKKSTETQSTLISPLDQHAFGSRNDFKTITKTRFHGFFQTLWAKQKDKNQSNRLEIQPIRFLYSGFFPAIALVALLAFLTFGFVYYQIFPDSKPAFTIVEQRLESQPSFSGSNSFSYKSYTTSEHKIGFLDNQNLALNNKNIKALEPLFAEKPIISGTIGSIIVHLKIEKPPQLAVEGDKTFPKSKKMSIISAVQLPPKLLAPGQHAQFHFTPDDLQRIYLTTGIWAIDPKVPDWPNPTFVGKKNRLLQDPIFTFSKLVNLNRFSFFDTDKKMILSPEEGLKIPVQETETVTLKSKKPPEPNITNTFVSLVDPNEASGTILATPNTEPSPLITAPESIQPFFNKDNDTKPIIEAALSNEEILASLDLSRPPIRTQEPAAQDSSDLVTPYNIRPNLRPSTIKPAVTQRIDDTVIASLKPLKRPSNAILGKNVLVVTQAIAPEEEGEEARVKIGARTSSTSSRVAQLATIKNAINIRTINLLGVFNNGTKKRALIRLSSGRNVVVEVGDRLNGGRVAAIGEKELRYIKSGQNITLMLPRS